MSRSATRPRASLADWQQRTADAFAALSRSLEVDEPRIHALLPEADREQRLRLELERASGGVLAQAPVGIKDIFHVTGFETRAGSRLPAEVLAGPQGTAVSRLRAAGALILGKTVTTEFAYFAPGPTRNPHNLAHTPGGSSSGSAAAVAAGYCPLALGTQTIGSICRPASFCGVVGFKPSYDRIPRDGVLPLSPSLDHVGLFAGSVADADLAASVLIADWQGPAGGRQPRLAVPEGPYLDRATPESRRHLERVCATLSAAGWKLSAVAALEDIPEIEARNQTILAAEIARVHGDWYAEFRNLYDPRTAALIEQGLEISEESLADALDAKQRFSTDLAHTMDASDVDLWVTPAATGSAPEGLASTGDPAMNLPWTQAGLPALALPAGTDREALPLGVQLVGKPEDDEALLEWGGDLEAVLGRL